jgi:hypothetical protein
VKLPARIAEITPDWDAGGQSTYPPLGFLRFLESGLGNGDCFGLYWPLGREHLDPLVVETHHDASYLSPAFSSLDRFLAATGGSDEWVEPPTLEQDPRSPHAGLGAAKQLLIGNEIESAVAQLLDVVEVLPEFGAAQWLLSRQLSRLGRKLEAFAAAHAAIISPPCFGGASADALTWLRRQTQCPDEFVGDPLWRRRNELQFKFGGTKENPEYVVLQSLIAEYRNAGSGTLAMLLLQTYGELMRRETVSFRERYGFSIESHIDAQLRLGDELGIDRRMRAK